MIQKETGWTDEYLLWGLSWSNVQLKLADAPYNKLKNAGSKSEEVVESDDELRDWLESNM